MWGYLVDDSLGNTKVPIGECLLLGRTEDCGLTIRDAASSRHHMEILNQDGHFHWRDLDSTNGVYINDLRMKSGELHAGDQIRIGSAVYRFEIDENPEPSVTFVGEEGIHERIVESFSQREGAEGDEAGMLLEAVHSVMNDIASNYEPCGLVDRILETTMKAIDAQRGAIFFAGESEDTLMGCPVCNSVHLIEDGVLKHTEAHSIHVSQTVAKKVLNDGESVLVQDTGTDGELNVAESILALNLRSIICAPVRGKYGVLGILYVDTDRSNQTYTHAHMLLSTAVGNSAGLALENAKMHQEILQKQRMEQEIKLAGIIQEGFLTQNWESDDARYDVYGKTEPAKVVGGDFYDVVRLDDDRVALLVGDVSGKGVGAALAMAQILAEFRVHTSREKEAVEIVQALNRSMCERSQRGMFCTLCYLGIDLESGRAECVNAGHHAVLRVNRNEAVEVGESSGFPIGIVPDGEWNSDAFDLKPGDCVYLYSDGIAEARAGDTSLDSAQGCEEYGVEKLSALAQALAGEPAEVLVREVLKDVKRYCEPMVPHDDSTLVALRYSG